MYAQICYFEEWQSWTVNQYDAENNHALKRSLATARTKTRAEAVQ